MTEDIQETAKITDVALIRAPKQELVIERESSRGRSLSGEVLLPTEDIRTVSFMFPEADLGRVKELVGEYFFEQRQALVELRKTVGEVAVTGVGIYKIREFLDQCYKLVCGALNRKILQAGIDGSLLRAAIVEVCLSELSFEDGQRMIAWHFPQKFNRGETEGNIKELRENPDFKTLVGLIGFQKTVRVIQGWHRNLDRKERKQLSRQFEAFYPQALQAIDDYLIGEWRYTEAEIEAAEKVATNKISLK